MARCLSPIRLKVENKPNPYNDVPCGKCYNCLQRKRAEWSLRLQNELQYSSSAFFITLTYSDEYRLDKLNDYNNHETEEYVKDVCSVHKTHLQNWIKRFRKLNPNGVRYYAVGEYGTKSKRPHYHVLLFNCKPELLEANLQKSWTFGGTHVGNITDASIHYVTGYVINKYIAPNDLNPEFALMSRNPGIGSKKLEKIAEQMTNNIQPYIVSKGGYKFPIPRFYRDKIFSDEAIEKIKTIAQGFDEKTIKEKRREYSQHNEKLSKLQKLNKKI